MISYFGRLGISKLILWCYLAWYVAIVALYFDPSPLLWISSAGISIFVGIALNLATRQPGHKTDFWVMFRLFLIPFCVSSYSALIKGKGFVLLFPPRLHDLAIGLFACLIVIGLHGICRMLAAARKDPRAIVVDKLVQTADDRG